MFQETFVYTGDPSGRLASFTFDIYVGVGPMLCVEEHRGAVHPTEAASLLWTLHRRNLRGSWLAGFPGMFPVVSYLTYRTQLANVRRQAVTGLPERLPDGETPAETRTAMNGFFAVLVVAVLGMFAWRLLNPDGFAQFAAFFGHR